MWHAHVWHKVDPRTVGTQNEWRFVWAKNIELIKMIYKYAWRNSLEQLFRSLKLHAQLYATVEVQIRIQTQFWFVSETEILHQFRIGETNSHMT